MTLASKMRPFALAGFLTGCVMPIWMSLADHPLYGRSDARYATVSLTMARTGQWLVPQLNNKPHLTKPPLIYWLEGLSLRWLGPSELAVRLPSALANTALILAVAAFVGARWGFRCALLAAGLLSLMPLQVLMGRLTLTDPLLSLAWFGVLVSSLEAIRRPERRGWLWLLWFSAAVGFLTKGPVILIAFLVVAFWLGLAGQSSSLRRLAWPWGLPLAMAPVLTWGAVTALVEPEALSMWGQQIFGRFTAAADHPEPFWFFLPVFLVGLFPATAAMSLPVFNYSWRRAWESLRDGSDTAFWTLAVLVPLLAFSLSRGKLVSYLLPLAAPMAILVSRQLDRWLRHRSPPRHERWPDVRFTFLICAGAGVAAAAVFALAKFPPSTLLRFPGPPALGLLGSAIGLAVAWRYGTRARAGALLVVWLALLASWGWFFELEDVFLARTSTASLLSQIRDRVPVDSASIVTFGYEDPSLPFYGHPEARTIRSEAELVHLSRLLGPRLLIVADAGAWARHRRHAPDALARFEHVADWPQIPLTKPHVVLRPRPVLSQRPTAGDP